MHAPIKYAEKGLAVVANEGAVDFRHFCLTGTRDYGLPPEKCVEVDADGITLAVDLTRSDLLLEAELQRFAEPLDGQLHLRLRGAGAGELIGEGQSEFRWGPQGRIELTRRPRSS